jgi:aspartate/methionine/tyrosine aminotransferase
MDNTYEDFVYDDHQHHFTISSPNIIHVFSFSKAYGMMGWRVGYIAYPGKQLLEDSQQLVGCQLGSELMKVRSASGGQPLMLTHLTADQTRTQLQAQQS